MKAFLLAAGYGTRLKPITDKTAKCLVDINGQPLLSWWLKLLQNNGIDEVLINTHYLADQVESFAKEFNKKNNIKVFAVYEPVLLGSGGTIKKNREFVDNEKDFFICYADNLTNINLNKMYERHINNAKIVTMALFRTSIPKQCGIVEINERGIVNSFIEKPKDPKGNLANAGIYIANKAIFDFLSEKIPLDFGKDVLPKLVNNMYGYIMQDYLIDIGTINNYNKAQKEWKYDYYKDTF